MANRIVFVILSFFLMQCTSKSDTLFRFIDPDDSGVDFVNQIYETDNINIINMQYVYNGGGVAIGDFNNDGLGDIFFTGNMVPNKLYLNKGSLEFEDISKEAGIGGFKKWKSGVALVDINSDGWLDIYVCATISEDSVLRENMLFINQGVKEGNHPTFIDEAKKYGIADNSYSSNAAFFDADNDGDLDLYILTNSRQFDVQTTWRPKVNDGTSVNTDKLYRNNGNGTFTDVSHESGILCEGFGLGLAVLDVNKDGLSDVYVGNDYITNDLLYVNEGGGKFFNNIDHYIKHQSKFSMGNDVADINNDGYLDIITLDMLPETNLRKKTVLTGAGYTSYINNERYGYTNQHTRNMLQLNNGNSTFSEIGQLAGVYQTEWSWSPLFADFDNDGKKDLLVTNGFPMDITDRDFISFREQVNALVSTQDLLKEIPSVKIPNFAFKNNGDLTFTDVTKSWGFDQPSFASGAAYADLDNDGDLDYVVNNINSPASIYENTLNSAKGDQQKATHYLRLKFQGPEKNRSGLGAKITLRYDNGKLQYHEHSIYRGYISTVEDFVHFGTGAVSRVDTLLIEWPDGKKELLTDVSTDQLLTIDYKSARQLDIDLVHREKTALFKNTASKAKVSFKHVEEDKIDFNIQRTLPHKFSQAGPGIAVGDVNGDGTDDFYVGGAANFSGTLFTQDSKGTFQASEPFKNKPEEDTGVLLFDADGDKDLDMYCVSGSYEFEPGSQKYLDRLLINDGKGKFKVNEKALPPIVSSGSCIRAADFDADGDLDLFVGGRISPGKYPFADDSYLLRNDHGAFTNVTKEVCERLSNPGMVSDALWSDFDNDGKIDLIVVGEFMPVTFFKNKGNTFEMVSTSGIENLSGWFNSISGGDFDRDGDTDYVVGNLGLNQYYNVSMNQPLTVSAKDFDGNGSVDAILSCYVKAEDGIMKPFPVHFWDELNSQSPKFRRQFDKYREFAVVTTDKFFSPSDLKDALILTANYMASSYVENLGSGKFKMSALPIQAQVAPVNGIVVNDVNGDNNLDILLVGNDYANEPTSGRYDAFIGLTLIGDGKGSFAPLSVSQSGFFVNGDAKGLVVVSGAHENYFIATQNRDSLKVFSIAHPEPLVKLRPEALDNYVEFVFEDGTKQKVEFYYGSGYLSQSTRTVRIPHGVKEVIIHDSKGNIRKIVQGI